MGRGRDFVFTLSRARESYPQVLPTQLFMAKRGCFILFEGVDRCGKTTQAKRLVDTLTQRGQGTVFMRFPDRETAIGSQIDAYLRNAAELDDHAVHLLFSANRWEKR